MTSGYIDLWSNVPIAMAFLELIKLYKDKTESSLWFILILTSLAFFSKFLMWPAALLIFGCALGVSFSLCSVRRWVLICSLGLFSMGAWPIKNYLAHRNPFYPVATSAFSAKQDVNFKFINASAEDQIPAKFANLSRPVIFLLSAFEISRIYSPVRWSIDQWAEGGVENPSFRMGGWAVTTVVLIGMLITLSPLNLGASFWAFLFLMGVTSILPQSHELRYWLYIPLIGATLAAQKYPLISSNRKSVLLILIAINFIVVSISVSRRLEFRDISSYAPDRVESFLRSADKKQIYKPCDLPYDILYTGHELNQFHIQGCY